MFRNTTNFAITKSSMTQARSDHYDGVNAIYRLAAYVSIPKGTSSDGVRRQISRLRKELSILNVRANRINIYGDMLEIDFYPKGF
jgi:hypothetical protein